MNRIRRRQPDVLVYSPLVALSRLLRAYKGNGDMGESSGDGTRQHRSLRMALRGHREREQKTQQDVAQAMEWSISKVVRIEIGDSLVSSSDLRQLLSLYGVESSAERERMLRWARAAKNQPWRAYLDVLSASFVRFLGYEAGASRVWQVQPHFVPEVMQVEGYARAMLGGSDVVPRSALAIERLIEVRMTRGKWLLGTHPPSVVVFLGEAVIRRVVGGPTVMREQLEYLIRVAGFEHVSMRVVPFAAGVYPGVRDAFVLLAFEDPQEPEVLHIESSSDSGTRDGTNGAASKASIDLRAYQNALEQLDALAVPEERTVALLRASLAALPQGIPERATSRAI
jgi:transcriptional regulator with XRE-family HTH domain